MIRAIRIQLIVAALWIAWAIITPIDWLTDHLRRPQHDTPSKRGEVGGGAEISHLDRSV